MGKEQELATLRWNQEYLTGKYEGEGPVPFVGEIITLLEENNLSGGEGLYVGCGNGRNYVPLIDAGLNITGLDIAEEALKQVRARRPDNTNKLVCADFLDYQPPQPLDYLISIQVFQHGTQEEVAKHFAKTASLLKSGGLFFLRVNSVATQIFHNHKIIETSPEGGETLEYTDGPKTGLDIHFYTKEELERLTSKLFKPVAPLSEAVMGRKPPQTGQWVQWEGVWCKAS